MTEVAALEAFCTENGEALWKYVPQPASPPRKTNNQRTTTTNPKRIYKKKTKR